MTPVSAASETNLRTSAGLQGSDTAADVLDLEALRNRCMGNVELVQRVLDKFQQRIPEELAELENLLTAGNFEQVARVAHRLKGTSANAGAPGLREAAAEIENSGREARVGDVSVGIEHLRGEWEKYLDYVSTLFSTMDESAETGRPSTNAQP